MSDLQTDPGPWGAMSPAPLSDLRPPLPIGATIGLAWRVFKAAPWTFLALNLVPFAVAFIPVVEVITSPTHKASVGVQSAATIAQIALQFVLQGAIAFAAWQTMESATCTFGEALAVGFRRVLPLLGLSLLAVLIVIVGFVLLIVPGVIAALALSAAMPACVLEGLGPIAGLKRSAALTRGNRWRILGLGLAVIGIVIAVFLAIIVVMAVASAGGHIVAFLIATALFLACDLLLTSVLSILPTAVYAQLRQAAGRG